MSFRKVRQGLRAAWTAPRNCIFVFLTTLSSTWAPAHAQESANDTWGFRVGAFVADQDANATLGVSVGQGAESNLDFEDDLGLDSQQTVFRFDAFYNFGERHRLDFGAFDLSRVATSALERETQWGFTTYPIGVSIKTSLRFKVYKVAYTYKFLRRDASYLGVIGGLYVADTGLEMLRLDVGDGENRTLTAPLPVIGFRGEHFFADRWRAHASAELFFISIDGIEGSLHDFMLGIDYRLFDNAALGVGFNSTLTKIDALEKNFQANLRSEYTGALVYVEFGF